MKHRSWIPVLVLTSALAAWVGGRQVVEEIVAVVNDDIITLSEYKEEFEARYQMLSAQFRGEDLEKQVEFLRDNLLNMMITDRLLMQEAKKKNLNIDEQIKLYIDNLMEENNIDSVEELNRALRQQGTDPEEWRRALRESMIKEAVIISEVHRTIVIDESEVVNYYKLHPKEFIEPPEYKLRAIYLSAEERDDEEIEAKKREIAKKLTGGEEFSALVEVYSEGPGKERGGDLGSFRKGELEKILEEAVENLQVGDITPWLQVRNGWMLLKLDERKEERSRPFEEVRKEIEQKIFTQKSQKKLEEYFEELRRKSYIRILKPNPLDF